MPLSKTECNAVQEELRLRWKYQQFTINTNAEVCM